ncbi:MAG: dynamin family protein, partial [Streptosporangiaceae bacterium]
GPISSGKTMLINAMLGRRLLPTDSKTWTSTWVQVYDAPEFTAVAIIRKRDGTLEEHQIRESELETYLTVGGETEIRRYHGRGATVVSVTVGVPFTAVSKSLRLLDTPGSGGLRDAHLHMARAAIARADAMLFVARADAPISASERRFLADAVRRVTTCILVFTHRDIQTAQQANEAVLADTAMLCDSQQWEQIVSDPGEASELAERFKSVTALSVSSKNWLDASQKPQGTERARLSDVSRFPALLDAIDREIIQGIDILHRRNVLLLCDLLNSNVADRVDHTRRLLIGDPQAEAAQAKREQDIAKWMADNGDAWASELEKHRGALHDKLAELADDKAKDLDHAYRLKFQQMKTEDRDAAVKRLSEQPEALLDDMTELGTREIARALEAVRDLLGQDNLSQPIEQLIASRAVASRLSDPARPGGTKVTFDPNDLRTVIAGAMVGGGAAGVAVGAGLVAASATVFLLPIAAGAALFAHLAWKQRTHSQGVAEAVDYLIKIEQLIRSGVVQEATDAVDSAIEVLKSEITLGLAGLKAEIDANRKAKEDEVSPEERQRKIAECENLIGQATVLIAEGGDIARAWSSPSP